MRMLDVGEMEHFCGPGREWGLRADINNCRHDMQSKAEGDGMLLLVTSKDI